MKTLSNATKVLTISRWLQHKKYKEKYEKYKAQGRDRIADIFKSLMNKND